MKKRLITSILLVLTGSVFAQTGIIKGRVYNRVNNEAIPFANIVVDTALMGTISDVDGNYLIENLQPGTYNITCSYLGFEKVLVYEVRVTPAKPTVLDIPLIKASTDIDEVKIVAPLFNKTEEGPVSIRTINSTEIFRNPGGNRDISKVIQVLPGVASTVSFRNDIIVRGGGPNENRFYLDGIEVPNINHFATQGSSGGPVGMINVNFIREVDFYAGAFPANRGNALSSVMDFKQVNGNDERIATTIMAGLSDLGLTLDGPLGKKSTFIFSVRRSYLQLLFKALSFPFLPTYNDFQYKHRFKLNDKNQLTLIGLGAIDDFELNTSANKGVSDSTLIKRNNYILGNLPVSTQWNYTIGVKWVHFADNSYQTVVVSRNHLHNNATKYQDNVESSNLLLLDYNSQEIENKFRFESTKRKNGWKWNIGMGYENVLYTNSTYNKKEQSGQVTIIDFDSELTLHKFAVFTQLSKAVLNNRLTLSVGVRSDFNSYSDEMGNPLDQFSPRLSTSYAITSKLSANFNIGRYFQLPAYTVMGYRNEENTLINRENNITYIQSDHIVGGWEYTPTSYSKIAIEGFYKTYDNYPFLLNDSISLANLGGDFGVIGNDLVIPVSKGRSYGVELLMQQKLSSSVYGILAYTWVRSEFKDKGNTFIPSAWDNRHVLNVTAGKKLKKGWEIGLKFRLLGGAPYTPYNVSLSALKEVWDVEQKGVLDWDRLNEKRNAVSHGLDIRVDKKWFFRKWALNAYLDIQNCYNFQSRTQSYLDTVKDASGNPVEAPENPLAYKMYEIKNTAGTFLPSVGVMLEF